MKQFLYSFIFVILLSGFLHIKVSAQNPQLNEKWGCLIGKRCDVAGANCQGVDSPGYRDVHRARLTTDPKYPPNPGITYILECLGEICTSGNAAVDAKVFNRDVSDPELPLNKATATIEYKFEGMFKADGKTNEGNPINNPTSNIGPLEWQSVSKDMARRYMTLNFVDPNLAAVGQGNTLQLGTVNFKTANKECEIIRWDPYGRVFNSQTLEPVYNALVYLDKKDSKGNWVQYEDKMFGKVKNPYSSKPGIGTAEDGWFSFVVEDGTYRLRVVPPDVSLSYPYDIKKLNPNYSKIYSDIYPQGNSPTLVYDIVQKGKIQHRDIPLTSQTKILNEKKIAIKDIIRSRLNNGNQLFKIRLSYPFAKISGVYSTINDPPVRFKSIPFGKSVKGDQKADKDGWFSIEVDGSKFIPGEMFGEIEATKVDLTNPLLVITNKEKTNNNIFSLVKHQIEYFFKKNFIAQADDTNVSTFKFDPIPSYLEGYAYDNSGKTIPNATVGIYLSFSNRPYSQSKTDAKGYYRFSSETLPSMPYDIRYTTAIGNTVKTTPGKFITQNKEYFIKQKINPFIAQNQPKPSGIVDNNPTGTSSESGEIDKITPTVKVTEEVRENIIPSEVPVIDKKPEQQTQSSEKIIIVFVMLLILILVVGIILTVYLLKKKQTQTPFV